MGYSKEVSKDNLQSTALLTDGLTAAVQTVVP
jgi:hypothetical protein